MSIIVTDTGFGPDDWTDRYDAPTEITATTTALHLPPDTDPDRVPLPASLSMIRVDFPNFADGRGFTIARLLRARGYRGRLRAHGHILSDQYAMARRCGFDEVEIDAGLARRQPAPEWQFRTDWRAHDYQSRLRG